MSRNSLYSVLKLLGFLLVLIICIYVLFYSTYNGSNTENFSTSISTSASKYTSTSLIYTSCISNNSWITSKYNFNHNSNIQYIYESIPDKSTWNQISDIMNANDSSLLISDDISY